jgi:hypothetical protein
MEYMKEKDYFDAAPKNVGDCHSLDCGGCSGIFGQLLAK